MNEASRSELAVTAKTPPADVEAQGWLADAAKSAIDAFKAKPIESAGVALAAATLGAVALRLRSPFMETLSATDSAAVVREALRFGKFPERAPGQFVIPTFRVEGGPLRQNMFTIPEFNIVNAASVEAKLFSTVRPAIHRIVTRDGSGGGSGFLVDESGLIATANHVVANPDIQYFIRLIEGDVPARLVARDVANDVAILKVDRSMKHVRPLDLNLDAYSKKNGILNATSKDWDAAIALERQAYLVGFPNRAVQRVMTQGPADAFGLIKNLSPEARVIGGEKRELFQSAKVMHRVTSFGGNSGGPLMLQDGLVVGIHSEGRYGREFARATSVHHLSRLLDAVRYRPMVQGYREYATPVVVSTTDTAKQILIQSERARLVTPVPTTITVEVPRIIKPNI